MYKNLLKFRYFLLILLLLGCGENTNTKKSVSPETNTEPLAEEKNSNKKVILFFGDSLTAGMGLDPDLAFPALIQQKIDSVGYNYEVVNAGLSGETTASGKNRLDWVLNQPIAIFVLELGANDGLRGIPLQETRKNLNAIIASIRQRDPQTKIVLAGMQIPPNMGPEYTKEFRNLFPEIAAEKNVALIPFLLENVGGIPALNQEDGIHPTAEGHKIVAENVWDSLETLLEPDA